MDKDEIVEKVINEEKGLTEDSQNKTIKIDSWGYIDIEKGILLERISKYDFIYNIEGEIRIKNIGFECSNCQAIITTDNDKIRCGCGKLLTFENRVMTIKNKTFKLKEPLKSIPLYWTPTKEELRKLLIDTNRADNTKELFQEIVNYLETLFEFHNPHDSKIVALFILFSYVLPYFDSSFNLGIDATKGSGKTTLLEIMGLLMRHGFLADVSTASVPRLKVKEDLNIIIDELDALKNAEDIQGLIRKGQRRGNKYIRLNKNTFEPEVFDSFGVYAYSFRSVVEDAFKDRSLIIRTAKAKDSRLSVINLYKIPLLKPLFNKIFMWYVKNIFTFSCKSGEVVEVVGTFTRDYEHSRETIYDCLTKDFSPKEQEIIKSLFGRNSEIGYLVIQTAKFLNLDISEIIETTLKEKQEEDDTPDSIYFELIKVIFEQNIKNSSCWLLTKGEFAGCKFYDKTTCYIELVGKLKEKGLRGIGTPKFNSLLKDCGFIKNYNIKNQKVEGISKPCLIFDKSVLKKLSLDDEPPPKIEEIKVLN